MLVIEPRLNKKIVIKDTVSGTEWELWYFYREGGTVALAFDAPLSVQITDTSRTKKAKENRNGNGK